MFMGKYYTNFILLILIYCSVTISFNIGAGYCGISTFSTGSIYAAGAYTAAILYTTLGVPFLLSSLAGAVMAGLMSMIVTFSAYKVNGMYLSLVSFGMVEVVTKLIKLAGFTGGAGGFRLDRVIIFGQPLSMYGKYYIALGLLVVCFVVQKHIKESQWGRDFLAMKDDEVAAAGIGINFRRKRVFGFFISSLLTGFAGAAYAAYAGYISPDTFGFGFSVMVLLMVMTGGGATLSGPVVGAIIITVIPEFFNTNPELKNLFYGVMLVAMTQLLPNGIVGVLRNRFREIENNRYIQKMEVGDIEFGNYAPRQKYETEDVLVLKGLTRQFGGLTALGDLDLTVKRGTIHALIGPNGAGKTTTINNIMGNDTPTSGEVWFNGRQVTGTPVWDLVKMGVSRTYQHVRMFRELSVIDNVASGARMDIHYSFFDALFKTKKKRECDKQIYKEALECLTLLGIADKADETPDSMSSGQQKLMEIGRALIAKPDLLLLDEPCAGLTESETAQFADIMKRIRETGISILLIEHHMNLVMDVSDWITVIDHGMKISEGTPAAVAADPVVRKAYLGG
jgi:ABC-type branched-subunit amino acid transport system ATPase component/ABC-type branched-subunit amino acid transport system permease subunit